MELFEGLTPWRAEAPPRADAPISFSQGNAPGGPVMRPATPLAVADAELASLRAEIRQLVLEELRAALEPA
jgi:hypothetical protein